MIVFNCTKAAIKHLFPKHREGLEPTMHEIRPVPCFAIDYKGKKSAPVSQWLVTHNKIGGMDVLYVCHTNYRYTISITDIAKGDVESFLFILHGRLMAQFACWIEQMPFSISLGINELMENYFEAHQGMYFCQRWDASIQHSINKVSADLEAGFYTFGRLPENQEEGTLFDIETNLRYDHPSKIKRDIIPTNELFNDFLTHYMNVKKKDVMHYRASAEAFFKSMVINRFLSYSDEDEEPLTDDDYLEAIEAEYQALLEAGDEENATIFANLIRFKKMQQEQE